MVKRSDSMNPLDTGPEAEIRNVHYFSNVIAAAIRDASDAVHPAAMAGVLAFHQNAIMIRAQGAFFKPPSGPQLFVPEVGP